MRVQTKFLSVNTRGFQRHHATQTGHNKMVPDWRRVVDLKKARKFYDSTLEQSGTGHDAVVTRARYGNRESASWRP